MPKVTPLHAEDPDRVGRHRLTGRITGMPGAGPFYLAQAADGAQVTLRLLHGGWTRDAAARDRFAAEAGAARRVPPFCAARILDAGTEGEHAYLVSEYVPGPSLLEAMERDGPVGGAELAALALGSAAGLASVHQAGLVHGAFGPDHIILSAEGPRVIEFGITPPYGPATPSADMLAWAQTISFAALGRPAGTLEDLDVLPGVLREVVADCLAGDPAQRPAARVIVADLLDEPGPGAGTLAEGARRATELYQSVYLPPDPYDRDDDWADDGDLAGEPARQGHGAALAAGHGPGAQHRGSHSTHGHSTHGSPAHGHGTHGYGSHAHGAHQGARAHPPGGQRRAGSPPRRVRAWPIAAAAVVLVAVGAVIVHISQSGGGTGQTADRTQDTGSQTHSGGSTSPVSSTVSAAPSASATIPVPTSFAGTWSGQARQQSPADVFDVKVSLTAGTPTGSVSYSSASFSCAGQLSVQSDAHSMLTLRQGIIQGQHTCANGTVTLSEHTDGTLSFSFQGKTGPAASGTLTHT